MDKIDEGGIRLSPIGLSQNERISGPVDVNVLNTEDKITIPVVPTIKCKHCKSRIVPKILHAYDLKGCSCSIMAYCHKCAKVTFLKTDDYTSQKAKWEYVETTDRAFFVFPKEIVSISQKFCVAFEEANHAYLLKLNVVCGVGFRKALEYLIKDYCIYLHPELKQNVLKDELGKCIAEYIDNAQIKEVAERAVWLGNDESHYERKWSDKNVLDLIKIIDLLTDTIIHDERRKKLLEEMPSPKKR